MQLAIRDSHQGPFLTQVIHYGLAQQRLSAQQLEQIKSKAVLMSLKFADKFYNKYKMDLLERAAEDIIGVASLGLSELSHNNMDAALTLLTSPENIVKPFQKGWSLLSQVSIINANQKSLYVDVDAQLLQQVSSSPYVDQWQGLHHFKQAQSRFLQHQAVAVLKSTFFVGAAFEDGEYFGIEAMFAEAIIYRLCCQGAKVRQDLKHKLKHIIIEDEWINEEVLLSSMKSALALLPSDVAAIVSEDLGAQFVPQLMATLKFAKQYKKLLDDNTTPERRDAFEFKQSLSHPLLGWPQYIEV
jgi:hypothetical protein